MANDITLETIRRIQNSDGEMIDVKPYPEGPEWVFICNTDETSKEYFGEINLIMEPKFARLLAEALLKCADEVEKYETRI